MKRDYTIASVNKVLNILEFLSRQHRPMGLPELSRALGMPKPTAFRYLVTLEERGYVRKRPQTDEYALGLRVLELSTGALERLIVHDLALPHMRRLLNRFQETVNLAVLEGNQMVYVEILESPQPFKLSYQVGGRDHVHTTALGKCILAHLPEEQVTGIANTTGLPRRTPRTICTLPALLQELEAVRQRGYAVDDEENAQGVRCVGAPIFDRRGNIVAALSISAPAVRIDQARVREAGAALSEATAQISGQIGYLAP